MVQTTVGRRKKMTKLDNNWKNKDKNYKERALKKQKMLQHEMKKKEQLFRDKMREASLNELRWEEEMTQWKHHQSEWTKKRRHLMDKVQQWGKRFDQYQLQVTLEFENREEFWIKEEKNWQIEISKVYLAKKKLLEAVLLLQDNESMFESEQKQWFEREKDWLAEREVLLNKASKIEPKKESQDVGVQATEEKTQPAVASLGIQTDIKPEMASVNLQTCTLLQEIKEKELIFRNKMKESRLNELRWEKEMTQWKRYQNEWAKERRHLIDKVQEWEVKFDHHQLQVTLEFENREKFWIKEEKNWQIEISKVYLAKKELLEEVLLLRDKQALNKARLEAKLKEDPSKSQICAESQRDNLQPPTVLGNFKNICLRPNMEDKNATVKDTPAEMLPAKPKLQPATSAPHTLEPAVVLEENTAEKYKEDQLTTKKKKKNKKKRKSVRYHLLRRVFCMSFEDDDNI